MPMPIKVLNDRGAMFPKSSRPGRKSRWWRWGLGNEARERTVVDLYGPYAAVKREVLQMAEAAGDSIVECYRD